MTKTGFLSFLYVMTTAFFVYESSMRVNLFSKISKPNLLCSDIIPYFLLTLIPCMTIYLPFLPLTFFYLSWLAICLIQEQLSPMKYRKITDYGKIRFLIFSNIHLSVIGAISLLTTYTLKEIIESPSILLSCTAITMILFIVIKFVIITIDENLHFVLYQEQKKDFRYFYHFLYLSIASVLIQSVLCCFKISLGSSVSYLMLSNIISLVLMVNYIISLAMIFQVEHAESSFSLLNSSLNQADNRIKQLRTDAHFDELTHAHSRIYLVQEATRLLDSQILFSLVYIDLNHLKYINDTYGHKAGDEYLCNFVTEVRKLIRNDDVLARFGGDEFIIIMPHCTSQNAQIKIDNIKKQLCDGENKFPFSSGIVDSSESFKLDELISKADKLMYKEKTEKRQNKI